MPGWLIWAGGMYLILAWIGYLLARSAATYSPDEEFQRRVDRDAELRQADNDLERLIGRPPTARELWDNAPPDWED